MDNPVTASTVRAIGLVTSLLSQDDDHVPVTADYLRDARGDPADLILGLANLSRLLAVLASGSTGHTPEQVLQSVALQLQRQRP